LLPEAPAPEGIALLSGAQQIFRSIRDLQLYRKDRVPAALPLRRSLFPRHGGAVVTFFPPVTVVSFEISSGWLVAIHRYSPLAEWSPLARQNGTLPRRR